MRPQHADLEILAPKKFYEQNPHWTFWHRTRHVLAAVCRLKNRLVGYQKQIGKRIQSYGVEIVDAGLVDNPTKARAAASKFRREEADLIFLYVSTYALSSKVLPVVQKAGVPGVMLNLQPVPQLDCEKFNALGSAVLRREPSMNHWYLFAFDVNRKAMRTFVLSRLRELELLKEKFTPDTKFNPDEYLKGSFTVFKGDEDYEVVIEFDVWATDLIRGRKWHASQNFTELPNGTLRLTMRLNNIEEMEQWVLSWGLHATVLRPIELAKRLRHTIAGLAKRYAE